MITASCLSHMPDQVGCNLLADPLREAQVTRDSRRHSFNPNFIVVHLVYFTCFDRQVNFDWLYRGS